jgi:hypothetical protein
MSLKRIAAAVAAGASVLAVALPASASPPMTTSGGGFINPPATTSRQADGNTIVTFSTTGAQTSGGITATFTYAGRYVVHPNGSVTGTASGTYSGSAAGCGPTGSAFKDEFQGVIDSTGTPILDGVAHDVGQPTNGFHYLESFHQVGLTYTYTAQYHC